MLFNLTILRGVDLVAQDFNVVSADSSDPYCKVYVNDEKIGRTPTANGTLDPVWGGPASTFRFEGGGGTKITIQIRDHDLLSKDDPMGKVTFFASDMLARTDKKYPNIWADVEPTEGCEKVSGQVQVRLLAVEDAAAMSSESRYLMQEALGLERKISLGPKVENGSSSNDSVKDLIESAKSPVILNVYDVGHNSKVGKFNGISSTIGMGGIFHGAVEVFGREYSFGGAKADVCGIFCCSPTACPLHNYRESIYLGDCELSEAQVKLILKKMKPEWLASTYSFLRKNCCIFSNEFAIELGVGGIPEWVYSLKDVGIGLADLLGKDSGPELDTKDLCGERKVWTNIQVSESQNEMEDLTFQTVMVIRLQRNFRARKGQQRIEIIDPGDDDAKKSVSVENKEKTPRAFLGWQSGSKTSCSFFPPELCCGP